MGTPVYVVGHRHPDTDSIGSAIAYAHLKNCLGDARVRPARPGEISGETAFVLSHFGVAAPELLDDARGLDLILVDHNEVDQALPHIEQAHILEIWEHHRLGDLHTPEPIVIHFEPVGATATLIAQQYFARGVAPPRPMAGLLLASILSDTLCFRSPTTNEKDRQMASRLQPLAAVDMQAFGEQLLHAKTAGAEQKPAAAIVRDDFKEFRIGQARLGIGQLEVMQPEALASRKPDILREMRAILAERALTLVLLMITDIGRDASHIWAVGDHLEWVERAFGPFENQAVHVPGCMSRKKHVVPRLEAVIAAAGDVQPSTGSVDAPNQSNHTRAT
jgi:manganese-dependent inorganic pyrophosphatase